MQIKIELNIGKKVKKINDAFLHSENKLGNVENK